MKPEKRCTNRQCSMKGIVVRTDLSKCLGRDEDLQRNDILGNFLGDIFDGRSR